MRLVDRDRANFQVEPEAVSDYHPFQADVLGELRFVLDGLGVDTLAELHDLVQLGQAITSGLLGDAINWAESYRGDCSGQVKLLLRLAAHHGRPAGLIDLYRMVVAERPD